MEKVTKLLSDLERKITKGNKIIEKNPELRYSDVVKLALKSNSINTTLGKIQKEYERGFIPAADQQKVIVKHYEICIDLTEIQLQHTIKTKAHLDKLKVGGLVKRSVRQSDKAVGDAEKAMLSGTNEPVAKQELETYIRRRQDIFTKTYQEFEHTTGGEEAASATAEDDSD